MDFKKLFRLVHFLSPDQIRGFGIYMKGREKTKDWLLYSRILDHSEFNKGTEKSIRGEEFNNSSGYYVYRQRLAKFIIESLVEAKKGTSESIPFIKATYLWDMEDIGFKILIANMVEFWANEDLEELQVCFNFVEYLKNYFGISIQLPESVLKSEEFQQIKDNNRQLMSLINRIRSAFKLPILEKKIVARMILESLPPSDASTINKTLRLKVLGGISFLNGHYLRSFRLGEALVKKIESVPHIFPNIFLAKEIQLLALQSAQLELRNKAIHYAMRLSLMKPTTLFEETEIRGYSIKVGVCIATQYQSEELTGMVFNQLRENQALFQPDTQRKLFFTLALVFYSDEKWSQAIFCITSLHSIPATTPNELTWEPLLVLAICHCEVNSPDYAESIFQSAIRQAKKVSLKYPYAAIRAVMRFYYSIDADKKKNLQQDILKIRRILNDPNEKRASLTYSVEYLLVSKLIGDTIRSVPNKDVLVDISKMNSIVDIT